MYKAEKNTSGKADFSGQNLQGLPRIESDIEVLIADNNHITSLTSLPESLRVLSLARNKIAFLGNIESQVPYVISLNLTSNRLISLEGVSNCVYLQELRLANNYIGDDQITLLQNLKGLKILDVSHNHLRDTNFFKVLERLQELEELWNTSNDFTEWRMDFSMSKLKRLVLDSNKIQSIDFQKAFPSLQILSSKENNISSVKNIQNAENLFEVDLSGNEISDLLDCWSTLPRLKVLILKNNSLCIIPLLPHLEVLDISHNSFTSLTSLPKSLKELYVSHNSLTGLTVVPSITIADISYNKLADLKFLSSCSALEVLNAGYNLLTAAGQELGFLKKNIGLVDLDLRGMEIKPNVCAGFFNSFPKLEIFNGESVKEGDKKHIMSIRASNGWDNLSKSKLFPSCRSSFTEIENQNKPNALAEYSIFSDIKGENSLISSMASPLKQSTFKETNGFLDSEYELLAKELEINKRIFKLDLETRHLGDSLISGKELNSTPPEFLSVNRKKNNGFYLEKDKEMRAESKENSEMLRKNYFDERRISERPLGDSLISKRSESAGKTKEFSQAEIRKGSERKKNQTFGDSLLSNQEIYQVKPEIPKEKYEKKEYHSSNRPEHPQVSLEKSETPENSQFHMRKSSLKAYDKEDSTISFEISNDQSREKPPREPLKPIYESHRLKKSCCKHCCRKKKKRSVISQTTLKSNPIKKIEELPMFTDMATSPMNSLLQYTPLQKKFSSISPNRLPIDPQPLSSYRTQIPKQSHSFFSETPISNRNQSYLTDIGPLQKSPGTKYSHRSITPTTTYRASPNPEKNSSNSLLNYATTPPRPILSSEAFTPIICKISPKGTEFFLISQMLLNEEKKVLQVMKTYTYSLQKNFQVSKPKIFLKKDENLILFYLASEKVLENICKSPDGFASIKNGDVVLVKNLNGVREGGNQKTMVAVIVLASIKSLRPVRENTYIVTNFQDVAPVYFVEFE